LSFAGGCASTTLTIAVPVSTTQSPAVPSHFSVPAIKLLLLMVILVWLFARSVRQFSMRFRFVRIIMLAACGLSIAGCAFQTVGQSEGSDVRSAYIVTITASGPGAPTHSQAFLLNLSQ
jgi:hypothetical protein